MSRTDLTPTSYVVLGLLALGGPATSYDLKQRVAASIGNFWSFPHTQLYTEPARLVDLGLLTAERERGGRRRRTYSLTDAGREALRDWLADPQADPPEIRDQGLLKLFLSATVGEEQIRLAAAQRDAHQRKLGEYEGIDQAFGATRSPQRHVLGLGMAVERAYIAFWDQLARSDGTDRT